MAKVKAKRPFSFDLLQQSFAHCNNGVIYDVEMSRPATCACGEIHKCWFVANSSIVNIDVTRIVERLFIRTKEDADTILKYCFHRILMHSDLVNKECWTIKTGPGMYGQEISAVNLDAAVTTTLITILTRLMYMNNLDQVLYTLRYERNLFSLPPVSSCKIETILLSDLSGFTSKQLSPETILRYNGYLLPSCVCVRCGAKYYVVDGFRRLLVAQNDGKEQVDAIVLE